MNAPTKKDVAGMGRFLSIVTGDAAAPDITDHKLTNPFGSSPSGVDSSAVSGMKDILSRFYAASDGAVRSALVEGKKDSLLREAMDMEEIDAGIRIGAWEVHVREDANDRKSYDVRRGDEKIASDLKLYEAALGIVRALNDGKYINSVEVRAILREEEEYAAALSDAILFKRRLASGTENAKKAIYEDRYDQARERALKAKDRLKARVADLDRG